MNGTKVIVILGRTASGKSDLAVDIAIKYNGEVISADSRQVYKGLDIGTGKITTTEMRGIKHYLLDVADPKTKFSVSEYKSMAENAINEILNKGKIPILCGGTGYYIDSLIHDLKIPEVKPNIKLRKELSLKSTGELFSMLQKIDTERSENIDAKNPHRLIRAIEIAKELGKVPQLPTQKSYKYSVLKIGIETTDETLKERIKVRLLKRIKEGMIGEAKKLHIEGLSFKRMEELGLEYKYEALFLQGKLSEEEFIEQLGNAIWQYAKRQKTWFKRDREINWVKLEEKEKVDGLIEGFIK